jgi:hypothetical protein
MAPLAVGRRNCPKGRRTLALRTMTKLIVLCLSATAAVSVTGAAGVLLTGFSPLPLAEVSANDNRPASRRAARLRALS